MSSSVHTVEHLLYFTLLQLIVIVATARVFGWTARKLGQPRAVGEIVAGIALGPTLFAAAAPTAFAYVFKSTDGMAVSIISQLGLILLMLQVGMEFEFGLLRERRNRTATVFVSAAGILVPFALGCAGGIVSAPVLAPGINPVGYTLFCGVALSITAMPVLARIMLEFDLTRTRLGTVTISAAAVNDVIGWTLLASVAAIVTGGFSFGGTATRLLFLLGLLALAFYVARPLLGALLQRAGARTDPPQPLTPNALAIVLIFAFGASIATYQLGLFAIFGGFLIGVLLHDRAALVAAWRERIAPFVTVLFLPVFFTFTGLRTDVHGLGSPVLWAWCALFIVLAFAGKFGGCYLGARLAGVPKDEARAMAILMNTRGLMELVALNVGYDLGVIPTHVFTMLVLMALVTTVCTAPLLRLWLRRIGHTTPALRDA
ncbi:MAG TPA: cation:proton antiporter [Burkholderiaceae bacterium]|nr:cation:proton antiporter [Burkholderiaceae bacterium]